MNELDRLLAELGCEWRTDDIDYDSVMVETAPDVLPVLTVTE